MCLCWMCAALPCFYVYTQSEESTPYESATTDSEPVNELEGDELGNDIEGPMALWKEFESFGKVKSMTMNMH